MQVREKIQALLNSVFSYFPSARQTTPTKSIKHNIFISYSHNDRDIVENLRGELEKHGVNTWIYSKDRTMGEELWNEIENKMRNADIIIFMVSENTANSTGQKRELELAPKLPGKIFPLFLNGNIPSNCPAVLRNINGDFLDAYNVKRAALKIVKYAFPLLVKNKSEEPWHYPIPGNWLEISSLEGVIEQYLDIGDKLYFRAIRVLRK